jgi:hypothetical protein
MRKTSVWVLCGLMGLTTAAFVAAQTGAMGTETSTTTETSKTTTTKTTHHAAAKAKSASGDVTAVDATAKTVTVKGKTAEWTFTWDDKTTISPKGKTSADVTVGSHVTVWYKTSGDTKTATKISIHAPKAEAKKP